MIFQSAHSEMSLLKVHVDCSHCIPAEDLLPQRKHIDSWDEDKAYSTPGKWYHTVLKLCTYFSGVK